MQKYFKTSVFLLLAAVFLSVACKHSVHNEPAPVYTVSFDLNGGGGGITLNQQEITKNNKVTKPTTNPTRTGYIFQHWSKTPEGEAYNFDTPVVNNFKLFAVWKIQQHTVNFNLAGSTEGTAPDTQTIENGKTVTKPADPTRSGYSFKHWSKEDGGTAYDFATPVTDTFTLYAVWEVSPVQHTVTFNLDGGDEAAPVAQTIVNGDTVSKPADPIRSGYRFKYWSKETAGAAYNFSDPVTGSFTLYAVWEKNDPSSPEPEKHTVTFNLNGSSEGTVPQQQTIENGKTVTQPTNPSRSGHSFKHWSKESAGAPYNFSDPVTGTFTLYAVWEKNDPSSPEPEKHTVTFNLDGGAGTAPVAQTIVNGDTVSKPADPTRSGYTFKHWSKDQNGTTAYNFDTPVTGSFTLYAVWEAIPKYTITFNLNGSTEGTVPPQQTIEKGKTVAQPTNPSRSGHTFKHWSKETAGTAYNFSESVTSSFTLYAVWEAIPKYTITFNLNGSTEGTVPPQQTIEKGKTVAQPTNPSRSGYTFKHWSKETAGAAYNFSEPVTGSFNLYAVWEQNATPPPTPQTFTVSFDLDGGEGTAPVAQTIGNGNKVSKPADPIRSGHTFKHWSKDQNGATAYNFDTPVTGSFTLFAVWESSTPHYTVTVKDGNGGTDKIYYVNQNDKLPKLPNAKKKNTLFKHWSKVEGGADAYNFDDTVTDDFTLHAVYYDIPADQKRIYDIQGTNHASSLEGQNVANVPGIVTGIHYSKGSTDGFYMQDQDGDGNKVTSDGIFVYCGKNKVPTTLSIGDAATVTGKVAEFGNKGLTITQLSRVTKVDIKSSDNTLPEAIKLTPDEMVKSVATGPIGSLEPASEAIDFYESLEGMRVTVEKPKVVAENTGNTYYIAPYNAQGFSYRGGIMKPKYDANGNHVAAAMIPVYTVGCFSSTANAGVVGNHPTIGDYYEGDITGVIDYYVGKFTSYYRISLTKKLPTLNRGNIRPESSNIQFAEDKLNVVSYNLKNFSAGNDGDDGRAKQFADHFIKQLKAPDVICLIEIQDDSGPNDDATISSAETLDLLINEMKKGQDGKLYDKIWINPQKNTDGGAPGSNIRCAYLYRTDRVELVPDDDGTPTNADESDTKAEIIGTGTNAKLKANPARIGIGETAFNRCRKSLVAHFKFKDSINDGKDFFMINNHLSSKRGDEPVWGSQQPAPRASDAPRHGQARIVKNFIDSILAARSDAMIVSVGDYNDFWFSETMNIMKGTNMKNAVEELPENERYTFVYDAHSQTLDNIIVPNRAGVTISGADILNVNSEFGGKLSDHDPVFVQLSW